MRQFRHSKNVKDVTLTRTFECAVLSGLACRGVLKGHYINGANPFLILINILTGLVFGQFDINDLYP